MSIRRSICSCDPAYTYAGDRNTWNFIYTPAKSLPKGTRLKFDINSAGRNDWEIPTVELKEKTRLIFLKMADGKIVAGREYPRENCSPEYEFVLPAAVSSGSSVTIVMGDLRSDGKGERGIAAQNWIQRRRPFYLSIDTSGKGHYEEPEIFYIDVRGNHLERIIIHSPSYVSKNKRFDITLRFEDRYGNLTSFAPEGTTIELTHRNQRENLQWRLFVPEAGFITLPNLYFNEIGVYQIQLKVLSTGELFYSAPIYCLSESDDQLLWGLLHGESERFDSSADVESCLRHLRDDRGLNFFALSPFDTLEETSNDLWKLLQQAVIDFEEADRFIPFLGMQWMGVARHEGIRHLIHLKDGKQAIRQKDSRFSSLEKIYKHFSSKELLSIPTFTMAKGHSYDFSHYDPTYERVVEIYNAWGSSECTEKEGNPCPIRSEGRHGVAETGEGAIQKALSENCRFGFIAGGLDDRGPYSELFDADQVQYVPGLTAVVAREFSKAGIVEALLRRSCYATTGVRLLMRYTLAGAVMGGELNTQEKPGLLVNRHFAVVVAGTAPLLFVELLRNNQVIHRVDALRGAKSVEFTFDDSEPLDQVLLHPKNKGTPFVFYYLRAVQEDGHMAWASPIWVDLLPSSLPIKRSIHGTLEANTKEKKVHTPVPVTKKQEESTNRSVKSSEKKEQSSQKIQNSSKKQPEERSAESREPSAEVSVAPKTKKTTSKGMAKVGSKAKVASNSKKALDLISSTSKKKSVPVQAKTTKAKIDQKKPTAKTTSGQKVAPKQKAEKLKEKAKITLKPVTTVGTVKKKAPIKPSSQSTSKPKGSVKGLAKKKK